MSRFFLLVLLTTASLLAQTAASPSQPKPSAHAADHNWVSQQSALQDRARQILKSELSRKLDPACDPTTRSKMEFYNCFAADAAITERNYRAFAQALKASLAVPLPNSDPETYPAAKTFACGEGLCGGIRFWIRIR